MNYFSYFSEIEETFVRRRGKNLLISPLDWALIESWKERGVPLRIVLRAIDAVFDNAAHNPARRRNIKSLMYCREEVETQFAAWLETQIGTDDAGRRGRGDAETHGEVEAEIPQTEIVSHLRGISENLQRRRAELNGSWATFSAEILSDLRTAQEFFKTNGKLENLEAVLNELDHRIDERLPQIFDQTAFAKIKAETSAALRSHKNRMSADGYAQTFQTLLIKNLRDCAELPRFSLFYL